MNRIKIYGERDVEIDRNEGRPANLKGFVKGFVKIIFHLRAMIMSSRNILDMLQ